MNKNLLKSENIVYLGDDINDLEAMKLANFRACPSDAVDEIRKICNINLSKPGGKGCFRELVDKISLSLKKDD